VSTPSFHRQLRVEVPIERRSSDIRWLILESDASSGAWFLFGHRTLQEASEFDSWYLTQAAAMKAADEQWGVGAEDWRKDSSTL
jgi:hypothetical protein